MTAANKPSINHDDWTAYDRSGYRIGTPGVEVRRHADGTISIGRGLHREDELTITSDRIESALAGWYLTR
jgi:hypothetical protein